jgi:outer membrane protein TolC
MEAMYRNGYITELDLLKTRAGLSSLGPALLGLQNGYEQLLMVFRMDLGLDLDQELTLQGKVEVSPENWDADDLVERFLPGRTDIQQLLVNQKILENVKSLNFNQGRLPALILGWTYSPYQADPFDTDKWGEDGFSGDNGSLSVTVSVPLDDWLPRSGTANKIKEAQDNIDRLGYQKELALLAAEMEIRNLVMSLNTSREKLSVLAESVEINEQSLKMSRESYDNGGIALLDLETAENDLLQAETDLLSEKFNYISSLLDLEKALNTRLAR